MFKLVESDDYQTTIAKEIEMVGFSAYSKRSCSLVFKPAAPNVGIVFVCEGIEVKAISKNLKQDGYTHTTSLVLGAIEIKTTEHILSAIMGLGIDNIVVELPDGEIPFLSSSAEEFSRALINAEIKAQPVKRKVLMCLNKEKVYYESTDTTIEISPSNNLNIEVAIDFPNLVGKQQFKIKLTTESYFGQIAPSRSFMRSELDSNGNVWNNVKKIFPGISDNPMFSPVIVFDKHQFITPLKFVDEPVRHKILDMVGDLSLLGTRVIASFKVNKPGHEANKFLVNYILHTLQEEERNHLI